MIIKAYQVLDTYVFMCTCYVPGIRVPMIRIIYQVDTTSKLENNGRARYSVLNHMSVSVGNGISPRRLLAGVYCVL